MIVIKLLVIVLWIELVETLTAPYSARQRLLVLLVIWGLVMVLGTVWVI